MTDLCTSKCEPCRVGAPLLTETELDALKKDIPSWEVISVDGVQQLTRSFSFSNFVEGMTFAQKVGEIAEQEGHHPALLVEWGSVKVNWWTHKIGGLHKNDVVMAAKTDALEV